MSVRLFSGLPLCRTPSTEPIIPSLPVDHLACDRYDRKAVASCVTYGTPVVVRRLYRLITCSLLNSLYRVWHGTYTAGTVNFIPLSKMGRKSVYFPSHFWWPDVPKMHRIAQICTYIFKKFSGGNTQDPQNWKSLPQTPPSTIAHRHTFSQLPRPLVWHNAVYDLRVIIQWSFHVLINWSKDW